MENAPHLKRLVKAEKQDDLGRLEYHASYTDHEDSSTCWCHPYMSYRCPWNGNEVWVHNTLEA